MNQRLFSRLMAGLLLASFLSNASEARGGWRASIPGAGVCESRDHLPNTWDVESMALPPCWPGGLHAPAVQAVYGLVAPSAKAVLGLGIVVAAGEILPQIGAARISRRRSFPILGAFASALASRGTASAQQPDASAAKRQQVRPLIGKILDAGAREDAAQQLAGLPLEDPFVARDLLAWLLHEYSVQKAHGDDRFAAVLEDLIFGRLAKGDNGPDLLLQVIEQTMDRGVRAWAWRFFERVYPLSYRPWRNQTDRVAQRLTGALQSDETSAFAESWLKELPEARAPVWDALYLATVRDDRKAMRRLSDVAKSIARYLTSLPKPRSAVSLSAKISMVLSDPMLEKFPAMQRTINEIVDQYEPEPYPPPEILHWLVRLARLSETTAVQPELQDAAQDALETLTSRTAGLAEACAAYRLRSDQTVPPGEKRPVPPLRTLTRALQSGDREAAGLALRWMLAGVAPNLERYDFTPQMAENALMEFDPEAPATGQPLSKAKAPATAPLSGASASRPPPQFQIGRLTETGAGEGTVTLGFHPFGRSVHAAEAELQVPAGSSIVSVAPEAAVGQADKTLAWSRTERGAKIWIHNLLATDHGDGAATYSLSKKAMVDGLVATLVVKFDVAQPLPEVRAVHVTFAGADAQEVQAPSGPADSTPEETPIPAPPASLWTTMYLPEKAGEIPLRRSVFEALIARQSESERRGAPVSHELLRILNGMAFRYGGALAAMAEETLDPRIRARLLELQKFIEQAHDRRAGPRRGVERAA